MKPTEYIDTLMENNFDDYMYRHLISEIDIVEEKIKELQAKRIAPNSKVIKTSSGEMTVSDYNLMKRKRELEYLEDRLRNLNQDLDKLQRDKI